MAFLVCRRHATVPSRSAFTLSVVASPPLRACELRTRSRFCLPFYEFSEPDSKSVVAGECVVVVGHSVRVRAGKRRATWSSSKRASWSCSPISSERASERVISLCLILTCAVDRVEKLMFGAKVCGTAGCALWSTWVVGAACLLARTRCARCCATLAGRRCRASRYRLLSTRSWRRG